jgi:Arc/MetJ-type ribon-helix-helix transcriptional regulator
MVPIAVRFDDSEVEELDALIERGLFANRTEAVRAALRSLLKAERERELVEQYRRAFETQPQVEVDWDTTLLADTTDPADESLLP